MQASQMLRGLLSCPSEGAASQKRSGAVIRAPTCLSDSLQCIGLGTRHLSSRPCADSRRCCWRGRAAYVVLAAQLPPSFPRVVEGIARRGDVSIPEFHVFATPRSSEVFRLIFPEGQPEWPGIVLVATALAVLAEGLQLAVGGVTKAWREADLPDDDEQQQLEAPQGLSATEEPAPQFAAQQLDYDSDDGWGGWGEPVSQPAAVVGDSASSRDEATSTSVSAALDDTARRPVEAEVVRSWGATGRQSAETAVRDAQQAAWERLYLSRDLHDERNRGLLLLAAVTLVALWATGVLNPPAHDPLDASA